VVIVSFPRGIVDVVDVAVVAAAVDVGTVVVVVLAEAVEVAAVEVAAVEVGAVEVAAVDVPVLVEDVPVLVEDVPVPVVVEVAPVSVELLIVVITSAGVSPASVEPAAKSPSDSSASVPARRHDGTCRCPFRHLLATVSLPFASVALSSRRPESDSSPTLSSRLGQARRLARRGATGNQLKYGLLHLQ
jgi:hypothetical protein